MTDGGVQGFGKEFGLGCHCTPHPPHDFLRRCSFMAPLAVLPIDAQSQEQCLFLGSKQYPLIHSYRLMALPGATRVRCAKAGTWCIVKHPPFADCIGEVHPSVRH